MDIIKSVSFIMPYSLVSAPQLLSLELSFLEGICPSITVLQFCILCCQASVFSLTFIFTCYKCNSGSSIVLRKLYTSELFLTPLLYRADSAMSSSFTGLLFTVNSFYLPYVLLLPLGYLIHIWVLIYPIFFPSTSIWRSIIS